MLTEFGKLLRKYRIENNLLLKNMADNLSIPSSYLSAIEMGRKTISNDFLEKLFNTYSFTKEEKEELTKAAELSANSIKIDLHDVNSKKRNMILSFARKFNDFDEETVEKFMKYLEEGGGNE